MSYIPVAPYIVQSGKKKGKCIERLMFDDHGWVRYMLDLLNRKSAGGKNHLHQHLSWIVAQGENRKPTMLCPQCTKKPAAFFSVLGSHTYGYSMSSAYTCCDDPGCMNALLAQGIEKTPILYPLVFSSMDHFPLKTDKRQVARILKECHALPKKLTNNILFDFFKK